MNIRFYDTLSAILRPYYGLLWPSRVTGAENIPETGGFILCANHVHWRDCLFLAVRLNKRRYTYLAKAELYKNPVARLILGDIRRALKTISDGEGLGIFPQGTRSRDNSPTPMLNGASMIAVRANVPIIPVYLDGPYRLFRHVDVTVGKPVEIADLGRKYDSATLTEVTRRIETAIWSMRKAEK